MHVQETSAYAVSVCPRSTIYVSHHGNTAQQMAHLEMRSTDKADKKMKIKDLCETECQIVPLPFPTLTSHF